MKGGIGYVPENTVKKTQPGKLSEQLVSSVAAELRYIGRSVYSKNANAQNGSNFEFELKTQILFFFYVIVDFQDRNSRELKKSSDIYSLDCPSHVLNILLELKNTLMLA